MKTHTEPKEVSELRDALQRVRAALARKREQFTQDKARKSEAERVFVAECAAAEIDGKPAPKAPALLRALAEQEASAAAICAELEARERNLLGELRSTCYSWGEGLLREQYAADSAAGRKALEGLALSAGELVRALGPFGKQLARELLDAIPRSVEVERLERISAFNGIFSEYGDRSPAQSIDSSLMIEAQTPTLAEARALALAS